MAILDICLFLTALGLFEYFSENGCFQKIKDISITVRQLLNIQFWVKVGR